MTQQPNPVSGDVESWMDTVWEALWEWQDAHEGRNAVGYSTQHKKLGGKSQRTKDIRSATPRGFAKAVFTSNQIMETVQ